MNTHILIPIKDIEDKIADLKRQILACQKNKEKENEVQIFIEIATIQELARKGKQISLDEKDKDFYKSRAKVSLNEKFFDTIQGGEIHCYIKGYKQALKDLL